MNTSVVAGYRIGLYQALGGHIEHPGQNDGNREAQRCSGEHCRDSPVGQADDREEDVCYLQQRPATRRIQRGDPIDSPALELREEASRDLCLASDQAVGGGAHVAG